MSLADELLADLEDNDDVEDELPDTNDDEFDDKIEDEPVIEEVEAMEIDVKVQSIRDLCKLRDSEKLGSILTQVDKYIKAPRTSSEMIGNVESDPEYQLIVEANNIAVEIDNEICMVFP